MVPTDHDPYAPHSGGEGSGGGSDYTPANEANQVAIGNVEQKAAAHKKDVMNVNEIAKRDYDDVPNAGVVGGVPVEGPAPGSGPEDEADAAAEEAAASAPEPAPEATADQAAGVAPSVNPDMQSEATPAETNATSAMDTITRERNETFDQDGNPVVQAADLDGSDESGDDAPPASAEDVTEKGETPPSGEEGASTEGESSADESGSDDKDEKPAKKAAAKKAAKKA